MALRFRFLVGSPGSTRAPSARWDRCSGGPGAQPRAFFDDDFALHTVLEGSIVGLRAARELAAAGAHDPGDGVGFGLLSSSAILVHLSGGVIELHSTSS